MFDIGDEVILLDNFGAPGWDENVHDQYLGKKLIILGKNIIGWFKVSHNGSTLSKTVHPDWLELSEEKKKPMELKLDAFQTRESSTGRCPLCGCKGKISAISFYCSNAFCRNYDDMFCVEELL